VLYINTQTAQALGIADGDWVWVESQWGRVRCKAGHSQAVEPGTVWTWNAIGKAAGAWNLAPDANEARTGFLLNHLISEELPARGSGERVSNSDPITGQAAWYDVRVRVSKADTGEPARSEPQFEPMQAYVGMARRPSVLASLLHGAAATKGRAK
jgi:anaerobic selenocysteine-containing dehydrogenase